MAVDRATANGDTDNRGVEGAGYAELPTARGSVVAVVQGNEVAGVGEGNRG